MLRVDVDAPTANRREQTILIADDEDGLRGLMREVLEDEGYTVFEAASGVNAIATLEHHAIDLLVVDHGLPGLSGSDLVDAASKACPGLRILCISGNPERERSGWAFLAKPFHTAALTAKVRELMCPPGGL
jgi:two-component system cell cycle sensor histidine kinase/response regulator CckA